MSSSEDPEKHRALFLSAFPAEAATFDEIARDVRAGRAFIEVSPDGTSFAVLETIKELHVRTVGGTMEGVLDLEASIAHRAQGAGYDRMTARPSRTGWDLALRARGWREEKIDELVKELGA